MFINITELCHEINILVPRQSRDTLTVVTSIVGVDKLYKTAGLENAMAPPRKPENMPRRVIRVGIPKAECLVMLVTKRDRWESTSQRASNV